MAIFTSTLTGGSNNHETTAEAINAQATDFVTAGVIAPIANTGGVAPATGNFAVNAQSPAAMAVDVTSGIAYVTGTPTGQNSQTLRVRSTATEEVAIQENSSGSTRYDWIYLSIDPDNAANPAVAGDDVTTLVVSRSTSSSSDDGTPPTYGLLLAKVTVSNGASSITNGNITDARVITTNVPDGSLTTDKYQDGSVTAEKLDFGGAGTGIWWEEIGRTTLASAGDTITVSSLPERKYLKVMACFIPSGSCTAYITFNGDTTTGNYNRKTADNNGSNSDSTGALLYTTTSMTDITLVEASIVNVANQNKVVFSEAATSAGDNSAPTKRVLTGQWGNNVDAITRIDFTNDGGGDYAAGTELIVLGHD